MDIKGISTTFTLLLCLLNCCGGGRLYQPRSNKYYYDPYQDEALMSEGEEMCSLSKATLRTILRGLIAVLTKVFPECALVEAPCSPREEKKEEPIKIFRQIISCPGVGLPYYNPSGCTPRTQIPPPPLMPTVMHTQV